MPKIWKHRWTKRLLLASSHICVAPQNPKDPLHLIVCPKGRASIAANSPSCRAACPGGSGEGQYCPFIGFTMWEVTIEGERAKRTGNGGGLALWAYKAYYWQNKQAKLAHCLLLPSKYLHIVDALGGERELHICACHSLIYPHRPLLGSAPTV